MKRQLQEVLDDIPTMEAGALPSLLGELRRLEATAMARLYAPASQQHRPDELVDVGEAARRLSVSKDYIYRNSARFPFTRREGGRLLFSTNGIDQYIGHKRHAG